MIQSLNSFTVHPHYGRSSTTFDICLDRGRAPVVRAHKDGAYDGVRQYEVHAGPELDQLIGYVASFDAWSVGRSQLGEVRHRFRILHHTQWIFAQKGLGELVGEPVGVSSRLRRGSSLSTILDNPATDVVFSSRFHFRSPESAGFELTRLRGLRARYAVKVCDDRVDRLLVLACVVHFARFSTEDVRQAIVDLASNPFRE